MLTLHLHWIALEHFSFRAFRIHIEYRWPGIVGKAPGGGRKPGRGGVAGLIEQRTERISKPGTLPPLHIGSCPFCS